MMSDLRSPRKYEKPKKSNLVTNDTTFETQGFISIIESLTRYFELCLVVFPRFHFFREFLVGFSSKDNKGNPCHTDSKMKAFHSCLNL